MFDAIINAVEAAILAVGRLRTVPEWRGNQWVPHRVISGTLSVDHQIADWAQFLAGMQAALSDWELLL
jgi:pyruvate dehydrogenase E2 component (dihydrolipoamide acetyltransferase)